MNSVIINGRITKDKKPFVRRYGRASIMSS